MNPCGRITDLIRCAHDEDCKFFRNTNTVQTVRFYDAAEDAPTLGMWNVIDSGTNGMPRWPEWVLGGKRPNFVEFTEAKAPAGLRYDHVCGTPDDFANGATFDAARPPLQIGAQGLPLCCAPPPLLLGAAGAGGKGVYKVISRPPVSFWGFAKAQNVRIDSGVVVTTGGGGFPTYIYIIGHYVPPTPATWKLLRTWADPTNTVHGGLFYNLTTNPVEIFGPVATGTDLFSYMTLLPNGSANFADGPDAHVTGTSLAPPNVNTAPEPTLVASVWMLEGVNSPLISYPNAFSWTFTNFNDAGAKAYMQGSAVITSAGTPFSPGAAFFFATYPAVSFSDSNI